MKRINNKNSINLPETLSSELVVNARYYALKCHTQTNHLYDGKPYETHLKMVVNYAIKYSFLVNKKSLEKVIASAWTHDVIEDCRETYNDVKDKLGIQIAKITYALTNEKGKTRKQRANKKYYEGINRTPYATYIKLCDRLANILYSKEQKSSMIEKYREEHINFRKKLYSIEYHPMWEELDSLLNQNH
jgi:(p)ppGpp synthase/HD superfamily hydrolase